MVTDMGRRKTHILLGTDELARLKQVARSDKDRRARERARFALLAGTGEHTLDEMAWQLVRQRSTVLTWLGKFQAGGVSALLDRRTPPRSSRRAEMKLAGKTCAENHDVGGGLGVGVSLEGVIGQANCTEQIGLSGDVFL